MLPGIQLKHLLKRICRYLDEFLTLGAPEDAVLTTIVAVIDEHFVDMTMLYFLYNVTKLLTYIKPLSTWTRAAIAVNVVDRLEHMCTSVNDEIDMMMSNPYELLSLTPQKQHIKIDFTRSWPAMGLKSIAKTLRPGNVCRSLWKSNGTNFFIIEFELDG